MFPDIKPADALNYNKNNVTVYTTVDDMLFLYGLASQA
jgi:hypothetical protein